MIYYLVGYRKQIVRSNLEGSFPEKDKNEILAIEREYYSHFCDLIVESVKAFTLSETQARKRFITENPELPDKFYDQGKNIAVCGAHYGNWELYAITVAHHIKHTPVALYTTMTNAFFDNKMRKSRSRYGLNMLSISEYQKQGISRFDNSITATIFGTDQSPRRSQKAYWTKFLNRDTAVQFGLEKFAKKYNVPVIYGDIHKLRRGYYKVQYHPICEDPSALPSGEITERHTRLTESIIKERPDYWLWSHKRWKLKKPAEEKVENHIS